ncbi:MAG: hypothetical protein IPL49_18495 [Saprospirales bacterium]|nr:hypothetical protein [Saprospirales bacterium]
MLESKFHIPFGAAVLLLWTGIGLLVAFWLLRHYMLPLVRNRQVHRELTRWLDIAQLLIWAAYLLLALVVFLQANFLITAVLLGLFLVIGLDYWRRLFARLALRLEKRLFPEPEDPEQHMAYIPLSFPASEKPPDADRLLQLARQCPWIIADSKIEIVEKGEGIFELKARLVGPGAVAQVQAFFANLPS